MYKYTNVQAQKTKYNLIYAEECYKIIGLAFQTFNELGASHKEKFFQKVLAQLFLANKIDYKEYLKVKVNFRGKELGIYIFDFLVFGKIVVELKVKNYFSKNDIAQLYKYLKATDLKLGLIIHFTKEGVKYKRIVNLN